MEGRVETDPAHGSAPQRGAGGQKTWRKHLAGVAWCTLGEGGVISTSLPPTGASPGRPWVQP